jgi:hypothetical protein
VRPRGRAAISKVLLVGGATRMPSVRRFITNMTGITPEDKDIDPDEAVALGAAVQVRAGRRGEGGSARRRPRALCAAARQQANAHGAAAPPARCPTRPASCKARYPTSWSW